MFNLISYDNSNTHSKKKSSTDERCCVLSTYIYYHKMKIEPAKINHLQSTTSDISSLEECFAKLDVDTKTTKLLKDFKGLSLKDGDGKLIERGPITNKNTKELVNNNKPYQKITENVNVRHNCGGTAYCVTQQNYEYNITNSPPVVQQQNNFLQATDFQPPQSCECFDLFNCNHCILKISNTPEFIQHCESLLKDIEQETALNITTVNDNIMNSSQTQQQQQQPTELIKKPFVRRISHDSGFQSDNPSPCSDYVLSPKPHPHTPTPQSSNNKIETLYRKILPKPKDNNMQKSEEKIMTKEISTEKKMIGQKEVKRTEQSAKEELRATLNPEVKQVKWIEIYVTKNGDDIFETCPKGQTILHKLLQDDDKYQAETLYATVEKMKMNPDRCSQIIAAQTSICDTIKEKKCPQLWLDYFCEAMEIIKVKIENNKSRK